jgi:hypothetical protein
MRSAATSLATAAVTLAALTAGCGAPTKSAGDVVCRTFYRDFRDDDSLATVA